jgi:hypothetical protein
VNPLFVTWLTAPSAKPAGAVKFADPSDWEAFGSFVNVSVKLFAVFKVWWTLAVYGLFDAACAEAAAATAATSPPKTRTATAFLRDLNRFKMLLPPHTPWSLRLQVFS